MRYTESWNLAGAAATAVVITGSTGLYRAQASSRHTETYARTTENKVEKHPCVGMWVTADGHVRQELLSNGRYDEARGNRKSAYQGRYEVTGNQIDYWDDTGFTADGEFIDDVLHHGGMIFYRER